MVEKGYDSEFGARPMRRAIQRYIEDPLSLMMLDGSIPDGSAILVTVTHEDELDFQVKTNERGKSRVPAETSAE